MVLLLISVSCESEMGIGNQDLNYQLDMSLQSAERYRVVMAVTDIAIGDNRLAFAIIGKDGPLIMDRINIKLSIAKDNLERSVTQLEAVFQPWPQGNAGVYIANADLKNSGEWIIHAIDPFKPDEVLGSVKFLVNKTSSSPSIGVKPKPLQNLTIKDVIDVNQITSSIKPDLELYTTSVSEAIDNGRPTIITFASPSFCRTATCGPQLEIISSLNARFRDRLDLIHIEVYERNEIGNDGNYELQVSGLLKEWGVNSEPFTFLLDKNGIIVAKFEGFVTESELENKIKEMLDI